MGKRELLIVMAFVVVGAVAYQLTAPATGPGQNRLSFSSLMSNLRREVRGNRAASSVTTQGSIGDLAALTDLRVSSVAEVTVTGENRADIGYELTIEANGPDEAAARESAGRSSLVQDRVGPSLLLRVAAAARGARQTAHLVLRIPSRLAVSVEGAPSGTRVRADNLAALHLNGVVGDSTAVRIAGAITGTHRNGSLQLSESGSVDVTLVSSKADVDQIRGAIVIAARNGRAEIRGASGPLQLDVTNQETVVVEPHGMVTVTGTGGKLRLTGPHARVSIDMRRTAVDATLARPVALTAITTDAVLRLALDGPPPVAVDAAATEGGLVDASALGLNVPVVDQESRLRHAFEDGTAEVALRNQRANIVIVLTK